MDNDIILGVFIIITGLSLLTYLVFWSQKTIEKISQKNLKSLREILKEINHDR